MGKRVHLRQNGRIHCLFFSYKRCIINLPLHPWSLISCLDVVPLYTEGEGKAVLNQTKQNVSVMQFPAGRSLKSLGAKTV